MFPHFAPSELGSLGMEFEGTVIDRITCEPRPIAQLVAEQAQAQVARGRLSPDLFTCVLELTTGLCRTIQQARADFEALWHATAPILEREGAALLAMGHHPTAVAGDVTALEETVYQELIERWQWPARRLLTTGIHVHVGMPSGDVAIATAQGIRATLPVLMALGAASPFRGGAATGLATTRVRLLDAFPRTGPMPRLESWEHYVEFCNALIHADAARTARDSWWDCRPQPTFGTLEIRVLDSLADLDDVVALGALAWCQAVGWPELERFDLPDLLTDENRWRAIRFGVNAEFIVDATGRTQPLCDVAEQVIESLEPTASRLGCERELERCRALARGLGAHHRLLAPGTSGDASVLAQALIGMRVDW